MVRENGIWFSIEIIEAVLGAEAVISGQDRMLGPRVLKVHAMS